MQKVEIKHALLRVIKSFFIQFRVNDEEKFAPARNKGTCAYLFYHIALEKI